MTKRDEFKAATRKHLAIRAAHMCSNPDCMRLTAGPHSDPNKSLQTGHAAHIHAASKGGPRYDGSQTISERRSAKNGIWLCRDCGDIADKDHKKFTAEELRRWKTVHEKLMSEIRTKGYNQSVELLSIRNNEQAQARAVFVAVSDRRALWEAFDAEFPDRVRSSLDKLRSRLLEIRSTTKADGPLDEALVKLTDTILLFFRRLEKTDLSSLKCDSKDPKWIAFRETLAVLRKSIGCQLLGISEDYSIQVTGELAKIVPGST